MTSKWYVFTSLGTCFYALLKDSFGERVRMLYTDTDSFFLHFFVDDLTKEINERPHLRDAFYFSEISNGHLSNLESGNAGLHAGEVGFFKDETKGNPIVEFVGLRPKMYSFTVCDASEPILPDGCAAKSGGKECAALPN